MYGAAEAQSPQNVFTCAASRSPARRYSPGLTPTIRLKGLLNEPPAPRHHLNAKYDRFVLSFGPISCKENFRAYAGDSRSRASAFVGRLRPGNEIGHQDQVFHERTIEGYKPVERVDTATEALVVSLNETGRVDWSRMAVLTGQSALALEAELTGLVFRNPKGNTWKTADAYLSANVRQKLHAAEAAAACASAFAPNVDGTPSRRSAARSTFFIT